MATIIFQRSGGVLGQEIDLFLALKACLLPNRNSSSS